MFKFVRDILVKLFALTKNDDDYLELVKKREQKTDSQKVETDTPPKSEPTVESPKEYHEDASKPKKLVIQADNETVKKIDLSEDNKNIKDSTPTMIKEEVPPEVVEEIVLPVLPENESKDITYLSQDFLPLQIDDSEYTHTESYKTTWGKELEPIRKLLLWGFDKDNNPSFIIFYGKQNFLSKVESESENVVHNLAPDVVYTSYIILSGKGSHLPSFPALKVVKENNVNVMYYKKAFFKFYSQTQIDKEFKFKNYFNLEESECFSLPFFEQKEYIEIVNLIKSKEIKLSGFKLADSPNDVLKIQNESYSKILSSIFSNKKLYIRKKLLNNLLTKTLTNENSKEILLLILKYGSSEVISGLFLELAKRNTKILINEANSIINSEILWVEENYANGIKRCAQIYLDSHSTENKQKAIDFIRENHANMDLHLSKLWGKNIDYTCNGRTYHTYLGYGMFVDKKAVYDYKTRKYNFKEPDIRYKKGPYNTGIRLDIHAVKNAIQVLQTNEVADLIGKIAYYFDAPRLKYYFLGSKKQKVHSYFQRYLRRIIDDYSNTNEDKFMEAMESLLTSYTLNDCNSEYTNNYQLNLFIRHYLYFDFKEKTPNKFTNWYEHHQFVSNDQLAKLKGRFEFKKEIWDKHLDVALKIATTSKIFDIIKACIYIIKESPNNVTLINSLDYENLIDLITYGNKHCALMSEYFTDIFVEKLNAKQNFDEDLMIYLLKLTPDKIRKASTDYFIRTNGKFSSQKIAHLLLLPNSTQWSDLILTNLNSLQGESYFNFVTELFKICEEFNKSNIKLSDQIADQLTNTLNKINTLEMKEKANIFSEILNLLSARKVMPEWLENIIDNLIFSIDYEDLEILVNNIEIPKSKLPASRTKRIIVLFDAIKSKEIPTDANIIDLFENGTSKMLNMLARLIFIQKSQLVDRFPTLLILMESPILSLNQVAQDIFDSINGEKQIKLHQILIDSPVKSVYSFGLDKLNKLYNDQIPKTFIIQMLEHGSIEVKDFISQKIDYTLNNLACGNVDLFMYYVKTLLLLPNKCSKQKSKVYEALPRFALTYRESIPTIEEILLDIGGSNSITDSERALVALAKIKMGSDLNAS